VGTSKIILGLGKVGREVVKKLDYNQVFFFGTVPIDTYKNQTKIIKGLVNDKRSTIKSINTQKKA
jgi:hypothetical protein